MKKLRVIVLLHPDLMPPLDYEPEPEVISEADWITEYDVITTLKKLGHEVLPLGLSEDLSLLRKAIEEFKPNLVFNLLEEFAGNPDYDQHVVSYLELKGIPYTGCNPRGLTLARDKALSKKILKYHRIQVPKFYVFEKNRAVKMKSDYPFPMIVKSLTEEASKGISQASVVNDYEKLKERVQYIHQSLDTDAIAEEYIEGRELYVAILGNKRIKILPIWELSLQDLPDGQHRLATERVKWSKKYREKHKIESQQAVQLTDEEREAVRSCCKRAYKALGLSGYARIDIRFTNGGKVYILEANPNPGIAYGDEFPEAAEAEGLSYDDMIAKIVSLGLSWYQHRG